MLMLIGVTCVSYMGRNVLGTVESIIGALCAVQCSLLLPTTFFLAIHHKHKRMRLQHWLGLGAMLGFGVMLIILTIAEALQGLLRFRPRAARGAAAFVTMPLLQDWSALSDAY